MSGGSLSHLCRFVEVSLHHHKEAGELVEFSKEKERNLLISLSQVFRQIQGWICELGSSPSTVEQPNNRVNEDQCVTKIVANLISFLSVESKYVQHSVGKILVAVSKFISGAECKMEASWESFIDLLCISLEVAISNALSHDSVNQIEHLNNDPLGPAVIRLGLKNSNWNTVAEILRIFRAIIKPLKEEPENSGGSLEILMKSLSLCFARLPWDTLDALHKCGNIVDQVGSSKSTLISATQTESRIIFLGNLVQLFCSMVEVVGKVESAATSQTTHSLIHRFKSLAPQISQWCISKEWIHHDMGILPYFQHKILMLMSRLSSQVWKDCSTVMLWLQLLHKYYEDFLTKPISHPEFDQDSCLEGSPFLWSLSNLEIDHISSSHLQRQSIFLFLRSSMCLIASEEPNHIHCGTSDSEADENCYARKACTVEFYKWLTLHIPFTMIADNEIFIKKCIDFSSSFIRLYIHEDDLLFQVLLQMFDVATFADKHRIFKYAFASQEPDKDTLFDISAPFNPILLFHVFLAELQYDHHLLLDYLISKDSGIRCAEYLLKCLRVVCDSWKMFVDLPHGLKNDGKRVHKKAKVSLESLEESTSTTSQNGLALLHKEYTKHDDPPSKRSGARSLNFLKAKTCLLSLKNALEKLRKRNLFPYSPEVLIRRLKRFEELCNRQSSHHVY